MSEAVDAAYARLRRAADAMPGHWSSQRHRRELMEALQDAPSVSAIRAEADERVAALELALIALDDAWRWVEEHYPKVLVEIPSLEPFTRARAALSDAAPEEAK